MTRSELSCYLRSAADVVTQAAGSDGEVRVGVGDGADDGGDVLDGRGVHGSGGDDVGVGAASSGVVESERALQFE